MPATAEHAITTGIIHSEITGAGDSAGIIAGILKISPERALDAHDDARLFYPETALRWLTENAERRLVESKIAIRLALKNGYHDPEGLSRCHAEGNASDLQSQMLLHRLLAENPDLTADVQACYAHCINRFRNAGITVADLTPAEIGQTMNLLVQQAGLPDLDCSRPSPANAALTLAQAAARNLKVTAEKLAETPDWGEDRIGDNAAIRAEALVKFTAECYALVAASLYLINRIAAP